MSLLGLRLIHQLMYWDMFFSLIVNSFASPQKARTCEHPQGSQLSPTLFNCFINNLFEILNCNILPTFLSALFIADSGILVVPTVNKAQSLVNTASHWADSHGISFNIPICGYIITNPAVSTHPPYTLTLYNQFIALVISYRYLGVLFESTGIDFHKQENLLCQHVDRSLAAMP